ncbi:MAG TPA: glutamine--fructose-6-phosphate transaminase (isomerizing) [Candidatus Saccharimonadales bacterium]|nr:glutamine--fructose-6-phosphate transaminase (isomerizing) [Candidatus Saccharimonadales bacterium]
MCGIVGYVGKQQAVPIILEGLRRLEYRGYDSAGISVLASGALKTCKRKGKIDEGLARLLVESPLAGALGLGHTRWATHGPPSDENSHPHADQSGRIVVVHNGVIENFDRLRERLQGHTFHSSTDTEVLAHLIGVHYEQLRTRNGKAQPAAPGKSEAHPLAQAVMNALREVIGAYGIAVICADFPDVMVGARRGSPLIVGVGEGENFLASDATAIASHTRQVIYLNDYDVVTLTADRFSVANLGSDTAKVQISKLEFDAEAAERGKYAHYMLKEIFEQPQTVRNALRGRVDLDEATAKFGGLNMTLAEMREIDHIVIPACGTSWHAALIGEYLFEEFAHIPTEVEYASEFRYRNAPIEKHTLVLVITQSGETADTLAGLRESKRRGHKVLAICNVVGSTIARESDGGIYLHAGPEIGVASTKAFTSQVTVLNLLALLMGRIRMLSSSHGLEILHALEAVPAQLEAILAQNEKIKKVALKYAKAEDFFFLGRQYNFPVALEGALKLKEISYIHAEGYPAAEMKHGPIAMIDEKTPTVFVIPSDSLYEKTFSNLEEIKARKGPIIALATEGNERIAKKVDDVIFLPPAPPPVFPLLAALPLQLLAYHIAVARGCDVDKPRNLAKSVTVE